MPHFLIICELGHFAGRWTHQLWFIFYLILKLWFLSPTLQCACTHTKAMGLWLEQERPRESSQRMHTCLSTVDQVIPSLACNPWLMDVVTNNGLGFYLKTQCLFCPFCLPSFTLPCLSTFGKVAMWPVGGGSDYLSYPQDLIWMQITHEVFEAPLPALPC